MTDSPPSPVTDSDEESPVRQPHQRGPTLPPQSPSPASATPNPPAHKAVPSSKEQQLIELLSNAAQEIRNERAKVAKLREENEELRTKVYESNKGKPRESSVGGKHTSKAEATTIQSMKNKMMDLSLENHLALEQITILRKKVVDLEAYVAQQQDEIKVLQDKKRHHPLMQGTESSQRRAVSAGGRKPPSSTTTTRSAGVRNTSPALVKSASSSPEKIPSKAHHFDAMQSVQASHHPTENGSEGMKTYNDMMIARLRRAIAPPPSKEQLSEVVHAMVLELTKSLAARGTRLSMRKVGPSQYVCGEKRRVHLTVDSGRLMVKCGGGHVDLLEYLERNKMCAPIDTRQQ